MPISSSNRRGAMFSLGAFTLYSSHDVIVKTLGGQYAPFQILFFSVLFGFPLVMLLLIRDTHAATLIPRHPWWMALRTAVVVVVGVCVFYAFSVLPLAQAYAIIFMMPFLITILSIPILGEKVGPRRWGAIIVGLIGVVVVIRPGGETLTLGHAAAVTGAALGALASVIVRKIGAEERSAVLLIYPMMANIVAMAIALPFVYQPMPFVDLALVAALSALAFCGGLFMIAAYRAGDAAIVAPMQYSQIIWAAVFGYVFFGETVDRLTWLGAAIIISSGVYIVLREASGGRSTTMPVLSENTRRPEVGTMPRISSLLRVMGKDHGKAPNRDQSRVFADDK
ncbi:MAG: DMT family transporter [Pseudomonadota bacterium]